ncbi:fatty acyl-AMP ligase [Kitasatospora sp. NPDC001119]
MTERKSGAMHEHLVSRLEAHSRTIPDKTAVAFVRVVDGEPVEKTLTYAELDREARRIASWLAGRCTVGERVMLLYGTGLEFVKVLMGCMYAGVVAVPAPVPGSQRGHDARSVGIVRDTDVRLILTDTPNAGVVSAFVADSGLTGVDAVVTDTLELAEAPGWRVPQLGPDTLVILQYTSGSTSTPKGVMVTHGSLFHNLQLIERAFGLDSGCLVASWLPQHHDMGLMGKVLEPLYLGTTTYLMAPMDFLRRPYLWLDLVSRKRIHTTVAPNFAYDLCVRRITDQQVATLDLSHLRNAGNGSEPISAATLHRFAEKFAPAGFSLDVFNPCYGMAETTLLVTGTPPGRRPAITSVDGDALAHKVLRPLPGDLEAPKLVSSGQIHGLDVRIVDPETRTTLPDGRAGEIWVRGRSVTAGYWNNPEETERTFRAMTAEGERGFLRTGDIGIIHDGELYVTGRTKEVLVINGRNLYPHDLERELQTVHASFQGLVASVCSVPADGEEIVVIQEYRPNPANPVELPELARRVRGELAEAAGVKVSNVVFLRPGQVHRTTSGKIQRRLMREKFMTGALEPLYEDLNTATRKRYRTPETAAAATGGTGETP